MLRGKLSMTFYKVGLAKSKHALKARGHLGTETVNKASTVLQVGFVKPAGSLTGEVVRLHYLKRRSGAPGLKFYACFDAEKGELVQANKDAVDAALDSRKQTAQPTAIVAALGTLLTDRLSMKQLIAQVMTKVEGGDKTIGNRLKELVVNKTLMPNAEGQQCLLQKEKVGREELFWLEPVPFPAGTGK